MAITKTALNSACAIAALAIAPAAFADAGHHAGAHGTPFDALPQARAGECFARILIPAQYNTVTQSVVLEEGYDRIAVTDPTFAPRTEDILVKDPASRYVVREPVYKTVTEQVIVREGYETYTVEPAQYETVTETVQVRAPRLAWKPGGQLPGAQATHVDPTSGAVYCLVEIPGETKTITRRVLVQPETTRTVTVPPQYATVTKQVLVQPAEVEELPIQAEYKTMTVQSLATGPRADRISVPAKTGVVDTKVLVSEERYDWVSVLCDTNADAATISDIQRALKDRSYYHGPIDGILGAQTHAAISAFQKDAGIPHSGYLSMETIDRLMGRASSYAPTSSLAPTHVEPHASLDHHGDDLLGGPSHVESRTEVTWIETASHHEAPANAPVTTRVAQPTMSAPAPAAMDRLHPGAAAAQVYSPTAHSGMTRSRVVRRHSVRSAHVAAEAAGDLDSMPANVIVPVTRGEGGGQGGGNALRADIVNVTLASDLIAQDAVDGGGVVAAPRTVSRVMTWSGK